MITTESLKWQEEALCTGVEPDLGGRDLFFPVYGNSEGQVARAKRWCRMCPVEQECLEYALTVPTLDVHGNPAHWVDGVWGGTVRSERKQIRAERGITKPGMDEDDD